MLYYQVSYALLWGTKVDFFRFNVFSVNFSFFLLNSIQVIMEELYRNLGLAFVCIFVTTLLLLSNFCACLQVLICVVLTLVNVAGFMHFWGKLSEEKKFFFSSLGRTSQGSDELHEVV